MLNKVRSHDGATVTIYSDKVAIGGLTSANDGHWYWALFGVVDTGLDETAPSLEFGGLEQDVDSAFAALSRHWQQWVNAAGLSYKAREFVN